MSNKAVIETARDIADGEQDNLFEVEGYTVKAKAIPAAIISDVTNRIPDPEIPTWYDKEIERNVSNPADPGYLQAKDDVDRKRGEAIMDAVVMFGIELPDGVPPTNDWLPKLRFMEKRGQVDLSGFDLDNPLELEFVFKRYIIANIGLIGYIQQMSTVTPEDITKAARPFRRKA